MCKKRKLNLNEEHKKGKEIHCVKKRSKQRKEREYMCDVFFSKVWRCITRVLMKQRKTKSSHFPDPVLSISDRSWQNPPWDPPYLLQRAQITTAGSSHQDQQQHPGHQCGPLDCGRGRDRDRDMGTWFLPSRRWNPQLLWKTRTLGLECPQKWGSITRTGPQQNHQADRRGGGSGGAEGEWLCHPAAEELLQMLVLWLNMPPAAALNMHDKVVIYLSLNFLFSSGDYITKPTTHRMVLYFSCHLKSKVK